MGLIFADGFDHYGSMSTATATNMSRGLYTDAIYNSSANYGYTCASDVQSRTGGRSLYMAFAGTGGRPRLRRPFPNGEVDTVFVGCGVYLPALPSANYAIAAQLRNLSNSEQISLVIGASGQMRVLRGDWDGTLLGSSNPVIVPASWQWIEAKFVGDNAAGSCEVRVQGETVLNLTGVDTLAASGLYGMWRAGHEEFVPGWYMDDLLVWDDIDIGDGFTDFVGPQRLYPRYMTADTAEADWVPNGAVNGYDCINEDTPDDETTYLFGQATAGDRSEFEIEDLPAEVSQVTGVYTYTLMRKEDAGTGNVQVSMVESGGAASAGVDNPITEVYNYYCDSFPVNPATTLPWTATEFNAAKKRIDKTA